MPPVSHTEWLNRNANRAYPFQENMGRLPVDPGGTLISDAQLPNYLLVDFVITIPGDPVLRAYLAQVAIVGNLLSMVFKDTADVQLTTLTIDLATHTAYQAYDLIGADTYSDVRGRVVLGDLANLADDLTEGLYELTDEQALFEAATVRPAVRAVRSLRTLSDGTESAFIYGHVKLIAGDNVQLSYDATLNAIRIDGVSGAGFEEECDCGDIGQDNNVRTINGIPIEDAWIVGDGECIDVTTEGNNIKIKDLCSEPCCGCPELEFVTESLKVLEASITNLEAYAQQLNERIDNFVTNFVLTVG